MKQARNKGGANSAFGYLQQVEPGRYLVRYIYEGRTLVIFAPRTHPFSGVSARYILFLVYYRVEPNPRFPLWGAVDHATRLISSTLSVSTEATMNEESGFNSVSMYGSE